MNIFISCAHFDESNMPTQLLPKIRYRHQKYISMSTIIIQPLASHPAQTTDYLPVMKFLVPTLELR